jgi:predicted lipid-binding transport protein (Tim44 family)
MKKALSLLAVVFALGLTTVSMDAEARRIGGGGKSMGMQRQAAPPPKSPDATPAQAPAATAGAPAAAGATAAAASTRSKWMGPIAGLAAGLGLAALASYLGFGEALANMLMIGLLIMAVLAVVAFVMRKRAAAQAGSGQRMAYAGQQPGGQSTPSFQGGGGGGSMIGSGIGANVPAHRPIPADFDVAGFVRNAKVNYLRLQAANDAGNLDDLREFTTPEVFAELQMDIQERAGAAQQTRVLELNGDVLEVAEEGNRYVVSVHFTGRVQEDGGAPDDINEIWHLTKAREGSGGWVLAGLQQVN